MRRRAARTRGGLTLASSLPWQLRQVQVPQVRLLPALTPASAAATATPPSAAAAAQPPGSQAVALATLAAAATAAARGAAAPPACMRHQARGRRAVRRMHAALLPPPHQGRRLPGARLQVEPHGHGHGLRRAPRSPSRPLCAAVLQMQSVRLLRR